MTTTARARRFDVEAAHQRAIERLRRPERTASPTRRAAMLGAAVVLFACSFAARLAVNDPDALLANFYVVPTVVLAIEFGPRAGPVAAMISLALVFAWGAIDAVHVSALGYVSRVAVVLITGTVVGRFSEQLRDDISDRQRAQHDLALYADQLEGANQHLARTVEQLEAFAEIVKAVGGETDLERVLSLILEHGREIVAARQLIAYLPDGDDLAAVTGTTQVAGARPPLPIRGSVAGEVFISGSPRRLGPDDQPGLAQLELGARAAILVPLVFRGQSLGVLAAIDRTDRRPLAEEDQQLLMSVAVSAATAVATARSVAAARLRLSLEAADEARARWARELHDETLQGLTGVRMVLSAGLARNELDALRQAVDTADAHLVEQTRKLRDLIAELRPAALDDLGLGPAMESLVKRQAAIAGFAVDAELHLDLAQRLPRDTETAIYRIVQEALSNAVKHSGAGRVLLRVEQLNDRVEVLVEDDGGGFEPLAVSEGFGLTGMRERAELAGGRLSVASEDGGPTSVTAVLPLSA